MFLFRSVKNPGFYGNFFIVVVITGQSSGERLQDHWSSGLKITCETDNLTISMRFKPLYRCICSLRVSTIAGVFGNYRLFQWLVEPHRT